MILERIETTGWHITPSIFLETDPTINGCKSITISFLKWSFDISWGHDDYLGYDPAEDERNFEAAMHECYVRLYARSNPPADFNKLLSEAPSNEWGQKEIDYMAYEISEEEMAEIVDDVANEYGLKEWKSKTFRNSIYLGCSPTFPKQK